MTTKILNDKKYVLVYPTTDINADVTYQYVCEIADRYMLTEDISMSVILHSSDDITWLKNILSDDGNFSFVKIPMDKIEYLDVHEITTKYIGPLIDS